MNITIIGIGHAGTTVAADLKAKGHYVKLLKTSNLLHNEHYNELIRNGGKVSITENGAEQNVIVDMITTDYEMALKDAELIILYVQTNYQEDVIKKMNPYLENGQIILIEPGYLATAYFIKHCSEKELIIVEAESSPIDCRITSPGRVSVLFRNICNPVGVFPEKAKSYALNKLSQLDYNFEAVDSVVEAALHNPNLIVHTIGAIMSIPRIEYSKGEYWMYKEVFTPHVWNLVLSLDGEKMNVLDKLGLKRLPYVEACKIRNSHDDSRDATDVFFEYAQNSSPKGPSAPNSRYITEDVPEGLVLLESLGKILGVSTPTCSSLIDLSGAALNTEFRKNGRSIERLGKDIIEVILNDRLLVSR
ncbi:NAD/NADP octopine/nopaline dehydrogenase family protein [Peribacillus frigoritolerans]|uniref:NAD/NADP octopine/nopaline dehydrogenase family protein n=1 Tax=Peribacillus frigoritolerans TaxID=450367 RepID=UPI003D2943B3